MQRPPHLQRRQTVPGRRIRIGPDQRPRDARKPRGAVSPDGLEPGAAGAPSRQRWRRCDRIDARVSRSRLLHQPSLEIVAGGRYRRPRVDSNHEGYSPFSHCFHHREVLNEGIEPSHTSFLAVKRVGSLLYLLSLNSGWCLSCHDSLGTHRAMGSVSAPAGPGARCR